MTIETINTTTILTGDGTTVTFPFDWAGSTVDDFTVYVTVDGELLESPADFTFNENSITFRDPPRAGARIFIGRATVIDQLRDWREFGPFQAEKTEGALDKLIVLKAEFAEWRARLNLATQRRVDSVTITNDKGDDAEILMWDGQGPDDDNLRNLRAGVVSAKLNKDYLPPRNALDSVEKRLWLSWSDAPEVPLLTSLQYPLIVEDAAQTVMGVVETTVRDWGTFQAQSIVGLDEVTLTVTVAYATHLAEDSAQSVIGLDEVTLAFFVNLVTELVTESAQSVIGLDSIMLDVVIAFVTHLATDGAQSIIGLDEVTLTTV